MAGYTAFADLEVGSSVRDKINTQFSELFVENTKAAITVVDETARLAIPAEYLTAGKIVYQLDTGLAYEWVIGVTWKLWVPMGNLQAENTKAFITVADETARLAIPAAYLSDGKIVYQLDTKTVYEYVLSGNTWKLWVPAGSQLYGECYLYGNTTAMAIDIANVYHACPNGAEGLNNGFTYKNGKVSAVASVATASGGTKIQCTSNSHGFLNGEIITITNSTNYDGVYAVESVTLNTFVVAKAYVTTRAFNAVRGFGLRANVNTTGTFIIDWNCTSKPAANNKTFVIEFNKNLLPEDKASVTQLLASTSDQQNMAAGCIVQITAGDYLWMAVKNLTDSVDLTIVNANLRVRRI